MVAVTRRKLTPWMLGVGGVTFLAGLLFGYDQGAISGARLVPETKGRSLEEIQERWVKNGDRMLDESDLYTRPPGPDALPG